MHLVSITAEISTKNENIFFYRFSTRPFYALLSCTLQPTPQISTKNVVVVVGFNRFSTLPVYALLKLFKHPQISCTLYLSLQQRYPLKMKIFFFYRFSTRPFYALLSCTLQPTAEISTKNVFCCCCF